MQSRKSKFIMLLVLFVFIFFFSNDFGLINVEKTSIITAVAIDYENDAKYAGVKEELMKHIVKLTAADKQSKDDWFAVETMADGETKGYHYMYLG